MTATAVVVMGVSGSGKTTVGKKLAQDRGMTFCDADDFHPPANVEKMRRGVPLDDEDRAGWLRALRARLDAALVRREPIVLACSALKENYRRALGIPHPAVRLVYLRVTRELAASRLATRKGHFMPASLVPTQFEDLEPPADAIVVDADAAVDQIVLEIERALG
jgi:gluconokinase